MAEGTDLSHLDKDSLEKFRTDSLNGIAAFVARLTTLTSTDPAVSPIASMELLSRVVKTPDTPYTTTPPRFGRLGTNDAKDETPIDGTPLVGFIESAAVSLAEILVKQRKLFAEIDDELIQTIKELGNAQSESLDGITGADFLLDWKDVNQVFTPDKPPTPPPPPSA
uniref:Type VII secretion system-associated protein n=1 Tax=Streptomyces sp. NBC_00049 TaxID=2903617 RepID=A0AAU2K057_9ACTN